MQGVVIQWAPKMGSKCDFYIKKNIEVLCQVMKCSLIEVWHLLIPWSIHSMIILYLYFSPGPVGGLGQSQLAWTGLLGEIKIENCYFSGYKITSQKLTALCNWPTRTDEPSKSWSAKNQMKNTLYQNKCLILFDLNLIKRLFAAFWERADWPTIDCNLWSPSSFLWLGLSSGSPVDAFSSVSLVWLRASPVQYLHTATEGQKNVCLCILLWKSITKWTQMKWYL